MPLCHDEAMLGTELLDGARCEVPQMAGIEFAKVQVDNGGDLVQSAIHAAQLRFRPILMTSLAFVLGMLPMVLASGPGSASRQAIGTGVFFGMIFAIVFGIVLVPFFFVLIYKAKAKVQHKIKKD